MLGPMCFFVQFHELGYYNYPLFFLLKFLVDHLLNIIIHVIGPKFDVQVGIFNVKWTIND
jgi:hypothetical protein